MKHLIAAFFALLAVVVWAKPDKYSTLATVSGRARCISRVSKDGMVIETWKRGNHVWANTNTQIRIVSARQTNTFEEKLSTLRKKVRTLHEDNTNLSAVVVSVRAKVKNVKNKAKDKKNKHADKANKANKGNGNTKKLYTEFSAELEELITDLEEIAGGDE